MSRKDKAKSKSTDAYNSLVDELDVAYEALRSRGGWNSPTIADALQLMAVRRMGRP